MESKWWSRLLKKEGKPPLFLKVDWNKWIDEDEQDEQGVIDVCFVTSLFLLDFNLLNLLNMSWGFQMKVI